MLGDALSLRIRPSGRALYSLPHRIFIDALKKAGIPDKAIESENQSLQRNTYHDPQESQMERDKKQFVLNQSWTVKTKADDAARVLHLAVEAGANQSGQIDWQYRDVNGLQAKAAGNALAKAQAIAQQMAQGLNVKLAGLIFASNQAPEGPQPPGPRPMAMMVSACDRSTACLASWKTSRGVIRTTSGLAASIVSTGAEPVSAWSAR